MWIRQDPDLVLPLSVSIRLLEYRDEILSTTFIAQHRHTFATQHNTLVTIELFQCDYISSPKVGDLMNLPFRQDYVAVIDLLLFVALANKIHNLI